MKATSIIKYIIIHIVMTRKKQTCDKV